MKFNGLPLGHLSNTNDRSMRKFSVICCITRLKLIGSVVINNYPLKRFSWGGQVGFVKVEVWLKGKVGRFKNGQKN